MEIENIAIFDGYVLDTFPCDLFQGSTVKPGNQSFFLSTQTSEKKSSKEKTSYKKIGNHSATLRTKITNKNIFNKKHVRHVLW